jgi:hypothetical protein
VRAGRSAIVVGALATAFYLGAVAEAASYTVRSTVDATRIGVEDQVQLTITLEGSDAPEAVALPTLTNLVVAGGPFQSTQVSIVNGRMTQTRSWTYVLQPQGEGRAEVGPVTAGTETAPALAIEVAPGRLLDRDPSRGSDPFGLDPFGDAFGRRRPQRRRATEPKVLVVASPSRTTLRVGEPLLLTYHLYTQVAVSDLNFKEAPQFTGFWAEELERPETLPSGEAATLNGESYRRFPILRKLLFPTRAGKLEIPATTFRIGLPARGFFDRSRAVERATKPVTVTVESLPEAPGFSGAVGRFDASATLDRDTLPLGDAAILRLRVEGSGNLKWIDRPPAVAVPGAKVYPPQVESDLKVTPQGIRGSRTWEFVVVPETSGSLEVPSVSFLYFDPKAQKIVAAETDPLPLRVEGGTVAPGAPVAPVAALGAGGALPLRADLDPPLLALPPLGGRAVAVLAALVLLGHAGLWGAGLVRGAFRRVGGRTTPVRSVRAALRDIERAGQVGVTKEQAAALLDKGLHEAFGDIAAGDESERARAVRALLSEVHFVRYAPQLGDYSETLGALAGRAGEAVKRWA